MTTATSYWGRIKNGLFKSTLIMFAAYTIIGLFYLKPIKALLFGASLTFFGWIIIIGLYALYDYFCLKIAFKKYRSVDYGITQFREVRFGMNRVAVFGYALKAIDELKGIREITTDKTNGIIEVRRRGRCSSQGEHIRIKISELAVDNSSVEIYSRPIMKWAFFDLANNYKNVEKINAYLRTVCGKIAERV